MKSKAEKVVVVSGYFDPLHVGHIEYFKLAKEMADELVVIVNNAEQCHLKKADEFMDEKDRLEIVKSLKMVDEVFLSIDKDKTVCASLEAIKPDVFANGGDRSVGEVPESKICQKHNIVMTDGLGDKIRSSSDLTGLKQI
jgi:D-beta-D-heptose 7-phosphate kinase/D-beta-D-heptose 1-phosphate adenosyltransferase